jgi:hypothetical protein
MLNILHFKVNIYQCTYKWGIKLYYGITEVMDNQQVILQYQFVYKMYNKYINTLKQPYNLIHRYHMVIQ